jgi:hypothetical protein
MAEGYPPLAHLVPSSAVSFNLTDCSDNELVYTEPLLGRNSVIMERSGALVTAPWQLLCLRHLQISINNTFNTCTFIILS